MNRKKKCQISAAVGPPSLSVAYFAVRRRQNGRGNQIEFKFYIRTSSQQRSQSRFRNHHTPTTLNKILWKNKIMGNGGIFSDIYIRNEICSIQDDSIYIHVFLVESVGATSVFIPHEKMNMNIFFSILASMSLLSRLFSSRPPPPRLLSENVSTIVSSFNETKRVSCGRAANKTERAIHRQQTRRIHSRIKEYEETVCINS